MSHENYFGYVAQQFIARFVNKFQNLSEHLHQHLRLDYLAMKPYWQNVVIHLSVKPKVFLVSLFFH